MVRIFFFLFASFCERAHPTYFIICFFISPLFQLPLTPPIPHIILLREKNKFCPPSPLFLLDLICLGLNVSHKNTLHSELAYQTVSSTDSPVDCMPFTVVPPEVWKPKAAFGLAIMILEYQSPCSALKSYPGGYIVPLKNFCFQSAEPTNQHTEPELFILFQ